MGNGCEGEKETLGRREGGERKRTKRGRGLTERGNGRQESTGAGEDWEGREKTWGAEDGEG